MFENCINEVGRLVSSPIAKLIIYFQQMRKMIPDFDSTEGEEIQDAMLNLILSLDKFESIENLYIDLRYIQDFLPEGQWG